MKYWVMLLPLLIMGCANSVEVEKKIEYKCGDKVIMAEFLDDDSIIVRVDGINNVLTRVAASEGRRFDNSITKVSLMQNSGDTYLTIDGINYPLCQEIED